MQIENENPLIHKIITRKRPENHQEIDNYEIFDLIRNINGFY